MNSEQILKRNSDWLELEQIVDRAGRFFYRLNADETLRLGALHRAVCLDLLQAIERDAPRETVERLRALVGRSHNLLYRARGLDRRAWGAMVFRHAPARLLHDPAVKIAAAFFLGAMAVTALLAAGREKVAATIIGQPMIEELDRMYAQPIGRLDSSTMGRNDSLMAGFYLQHNTSIGLRCFAWGIVFGVGSLSELLTNAIVLGTVMGHMARGPYAANFFTFVTAHSAFELTAIMLSAAAGLRMGWGLVDTQGEGRLDSLKREAKNALPALGAAVLLFILAAFVEGFVSASTLPYAAKAAVGMISLGLIASYLALGRSPSAAAGDAP